MKKENRGTKTVLPVLVPLVGSFLFIVSRVLNSAVTAPPFVGAIKRYYLFHSMRMIAMMGVTLLPLWLGYYYLQVRGKNPWKYLSKYWLQYVVGMVLPFIFFFFYRKMLNPRDLWVILFPISQDYLGFAVGFIIAFLALPKLTAWLDKQSDRYLKDIVLVLTVLLVGTSTLFSKNIWNLDGGRSFVWQLYVVVLGYTMRRFDLVAKCRFTLAKLLVSTAVACGMLYVMAGISLAIRDNISTAQRFSSPYGIFGFAFSLYLFIFIEKIQQRVHWQMAAKKLASLLIAVQVIVYNPLTTHCVSNYYRQPQVLSIYHWGLGIAKASGLYVLAALAIGVILWGLQRLKWVNRLDQKLAIASLGDVVAKGRDVVAFVVNRKRLFLLMAAFYVLVTFQMLAVIMATTDNPKPIFLENFFTYQGPLLLNVCIMTLFVVLIFLITNRFWYAVTFTTVVYILLIISSYLKISMRNEPVLPEDMKMITSINEIISMVQPTLIVIGLVSIVILMIGSWILQRNAQKKYHLKMGLRKRVAGIAVILVLFSGVFFLNHRNTPPNIIFRLFRVSKQFFYDQVRGARINGALVQFLINIDVEDMEKPKDYSKDAVEKLMTKYDKVAVELNADREDWQENQTFIFNLSESFTDPTRIPKIEVNKDPMPNIRQYKADNPSGLMVSPGYGGGTANIEWESMTGLAMSNLSPTLVTPYSQLVIKQEDTPNITNLFDQKIAIHPYNAKLYNRKLVFPQLGFQKFYYLGSEDKLTYKDKIPGSKYISDEAAYQETLKHLKESPEGSLFIQLSSMQNHTPYDHQYPEFDYDFTGPAVIADNHQAFKTYMQGVHYTDEAIKNFIAELDKIDRPITFLFYGDHFPSLFSGLSMNQYGLELHETDYFIYNNKYIRDRQDVDHPIVGPNNFSPLALQSANLKVTPYYAFLTKLMEELPTLSINPVSSSNNRFNGSQIFVTKDGKMIDESELTKKQQALLHEYRLIQYDLAVGEQYAADWAMQPVTE